jgi:hypothetical protein
VPRAHRPVTTTPQHHDPGTEPGDQPAHALRRGDKRDRAPRQRRAHDRAGDRDPQRRPGLLPVDTSDAATLTIDGGIPATAAFVSGGFAMPRNTPNSTATATTSGNAIPGPSASDATPPPASAVRATTSGNRGLRPPTNRPATGASTTTSSSHNYPRRQRRAATHLLYIQGGDEQERAESAQRPQRQHDRTTEQRAGWTSGSRPGWPRPWNGACRARV